MIFNSHPVQLKKLPQIEGYEKDALWNRKHSRSNSTAKKFIEIQKDNENYSRKDSSQKHESDLHRSMS